MAADPMTRSAGLCGDVAERTAGKFLPSHPVGSSRPTLRVYRESLARDPQVDLAIVAELLARAATDGATASLRLYHPARTVAFGPQDRLASGYEAAQVAARAREFSCVERLAGGRAAVYHEGTIGLAWTVPDPDARQHIRQHFERAAWLITDALRSLGSDARVGQLAGEYCPGTYSVNAGGRTKIAGIAQRVASGATHVGAVIVVSDSQAIRDVLTPVYAALDLAWNPATAGSVEDEIPGVQLDVVANAIASAFAQEYAVEHATISADVLAAAHVRVALTNGTRR